MTTVWVLVHEHKHGTDISVHRTRERALRAAMETLVAGLDDLTDLAATEALEDLILRGEYEAALVHWQSAVGTVEGQVLRIEQRPLLG